MGIMCGRRAFNLLDSNAFPPRTHRQLDGARPVRPQHGPIDDRLARIRYDASQIEVFHVPESR